MNLYEQERQDTKLDKKCCFRTRATLSFFGPFWNLFGGPQTIQSCIWTCFRNGAPHELGRPDNPDLIASLGPLAQVYKVGPPAEVPLDLFPSVLPDKLLIVDQDHTLRSPRVRASRHAATLAILSSRKNEDLTEAIG